ncbi:FlgO family outer membrane protein [Shewanella sp. 10N.286.48.B5]|uniref:FlgO family outer membrane protein n=1 Tax=Shewanella sp. 10N.286.48.B5 TaxID=1880834 RepID=UPI0039A5DA86
MEFQRRGFKVVDFKTTGSIQVTHTGDFALNRDWKDLAQEQDRPIRANRDYASPRGWCSS